MARRLSKLQHVPGPPRNHNVQQLHINQTNQARRPKHHQVTDEAELDRALLPRSFKRFVVDAFEVVEGGDAYAQGVRSGVYAPRFVDGWHIGAMCEHLQAVAEGQIKRLLINVPPGTTKSMLSSVLWPAWLWTRDPKVRMLFSSYAEEFTRRDTRKSKALIQSEWFKERFPDVVLKSEPDTMMEFHNTLGGERQGASTNSGVTGKHVHGIVEDDPLKMQDASSKVAREMAWEYRTQGLGFRLLPEAGWRVVVMQRLHEDDPSGRILKLRDEADPEEYVHLMLPMEFEPSRRCVTMLGFKDPRTKEGELLWPERMDAKFVADKKSPTKGLGEYGYAGQAQQRPAPAEGGVIKRAWLRRYSTLPKKFDLVWQSWDLALGDTNDQYAGGVFGSIGPDVYLLPHRPLDGRRAALVKFPVAVRAMKATHDKLGAREDAIVVENKAAGKPAIDTLREQKVPALAPWNPPGDKQVRVDAVSPFIEGGNFWIPDASLDPSIEHYVEELVTFPNATHDDQVDFTTQAILWWRKRRGRSGTAMKLGDAAAREAPGRIE